jgi:hypothetical protein
MILAEENCRPQRTTCPSATLFTTDPTRNILISKLDHLKCFGEEYRS